MTPYASLRPSGHVAQIKTFGNGLPLSDRGVTLAARYDLNSPHNRRRVNARVAPAGKPRHRYGHPRLAICGAGAAVCRLITHRVQMNAERSTVDRNPVVGHDAHPNLA
jgi:hypothetical protein